MASRQDDFLVGDDLDLIFTMIDEDLLEENPDLEDSEVSVASEEIKETFSCSFCAKICLTMRGLTRHTNAKHSEKTQDLPGGSNKKPPPEVVLHPIYLKKYIVKSVDKLKNNLCYPEHVRLEFKKYEAGPIEEVLPIYDLVRDVIKTFNGDAEKFYPKFYKVFIEAENPFRKLNRNCSLLLGFELANHVLSHLSHGVIKEDKVETCTSTSFTEKERSIVAYLAGYVFGTSYRRIRFSKAEKSSYHQQCLSLLSAGKYNEETNLKEHHLVNVHDRGGLWKVKREAVNIFCEAEAHFVNCTRTIHNKIDSKEMVGQLMQNCGLLHNYEKLKLCAEDVKSEVSKNLLEDLLMLYIRVRTFSYVKDKQQLHKIQAQKGKERSLRFELKKLSATSN